MSKGAKTMRCRKRGIVALALLVLALWPPTAQTTYNPLSATGGQTKLTPKQGATLKSGVVSFPVSGGKFDPTTSNGFIEHSGALYFQAGAKKVPLFNEIFAKPLGRPDAFAAGEALGTLQLRGGGGVGRKMS